MGIRFYTYPPNGIEWDYVLRNINQKPRKCKHEIVDIGIYDLLNPPYRHSISKLNYWNKMIVSGWKVVPDMPDLIGEFNLQIKDFDNVELTKKLHLEFYDPSNKRLLPVIQSKFGDIRSLYNYLVWFKDTFGDVDKIALAGVKALNKDYVVNACKMVRNFFPDAHIHGLGLKLYHVKHVYSYIDSYDSTAWSYGRNGYNWSCKNKKECIKFFNLYVNRLNSILDEL